ncbi:hypothetical protein HN018_19295 [Lichenicola cladoniae]|uniref:Peptidase M41 domain-containing protein n=1 Tax=Lichenicola cladoniae TaxID=1484109 RepID=A0A6M8HUL7_9PROT|nr:hypothetical protein [Lichenicola cladoniae]NPD68292.1 hypothetical protein [Acetobacteraceae bacterium]QKE91891.1 hypothetical protein HN018_19295 [Lichenicola cladoniae]
MTRSALAATAHHEAGHAFAAILKGVRFDYVTVEADMQRGSAGHVRFLRANAGFEATHKGAVVAMAGEAAQRRYNPRSIRVHHGEGDREEVAVKAMELCGGSAKAANLLVRLWDQQARDLVAGWWTEIGILADALLAKRRLSEAECRDVRATHRLGLAEPKVRE